MARHQPQADRVGRRHKDDGYGLRRFLRRDGRGQKYRHDQVELETDQIAGVLRVSLGSSIRPARLDRVVLPFDPAALAHPLAERLQRGLGGFGSGTAGKHHSNAVNLFSLLRAGEGRGGERGGGKQQITPLHSIPRSARKRIGCGTPRPDVFVAYLYRSPAYLPL